MKELAKLIKPMLKTDTTRLLAVSNIINEAKWLVVSITVSGALWILCPALAVWLRTLVAG